jgi:hypothetical protein
MAHSLAHYRLFVGIDVAATTCAVSSKRPNAQPLIDISVALAAAERQFVGQHLKQKLCFLLPTSLSSCILYSYTLRL